MPARCISFPTAPIFEIPRQSNQKNKEKPGSNLCFCFIHQRTKKSDFCIHVMGKKEYIVKRIKDSRHDYAISFQNCFFFNFKRIELTVQVPYSFSLFCLFKDHKNRIRRSRTTGRLKQTQFHLTVVVKGRVARCLVKGWYWYYKEKVENN